MSVHAHSPAAPAAGNFLASQAPSSSLRPSAEGKFLSVAGRRFWIRGVTYGTFLPNQDGDLLPEPEVVSRDMEQMALAGVNTVRTYTTPPIWFLDLALDHGLMVIAGVFWEGRQCLFEDEEAICRVEADVAAAVRRIARHPALLMVCLGNEIPPLVARWHGKRRIEQVLRRLRDRVKEVDPQLLVTYANYPPTEFLDLSFLDVIGFNVYLEREPEFRDYLARLQILAGDRPLFISELGLDSRSNGLERQAEVLDWQLRAVWEKGLAGAAVYAWTDEWAVAGTSIEEWDFGLVDRERRPKAALEQVRWNFWRSRYDFREEAWPRVSVVCCAYNAAATLEETLESLSRLHYPNFEVIVIDDGSRDATPEIAQRYPFRLIGTPNRGLSAARNVGIRAATGEIVAFIDSDATADPEWLYFLVTQMEARGAAACGGPNLSPPADPEVAQQVARAPGNPVHVLLDNDRAEHIPGCNMAVRKAALEAIGGFNPVYRVAGDDVDVCWKLLERGEKITFSPCALVWHHRRASQKAYLRQQQGYGYAEALLEARYPERYGLLGSATWRGRVYEGPQPALPMWPPGRMERVHHGPQGSGLFQSVYTPEAPWWFSLGLSPEFHCLNAAIAGSAAWMALTGLPFWQGPALLAAAGAASSAACCLEAGLRMCARDELEGAPLWRRVLGVARLHFLQPWARWIGRFKGNERMRREQPWPEEPEGVLWAGWDRRDEWLACLARLLRDAGMEVSEDDPWGYHDLHIRTFTGHVAVLESVVEHQTQVRFRAKVKTPLRLRLMEGALLALMVGTLAVPPTLPLLLPLAGSYFTLRREKRRLTAALALMGRKAGEILGMVPLEASGRVVKSANEQVGEQRRGDPERAPVQHAAVNGKRELGLHGAKGGERGADGSGAGEDSLASGPVSE
jgi:GT2 family glycosyltransferase